MPKKFRNFWKFRSDTPLLRNHYLHIVFLAVSNMSYSYPSSTFLVVSFAFISFFNSSDSWTNQKWFSNLPDLFAQCSFSDFQLSIISKNEVFSRKWPIKTKWTDVGGNLIKATVTVFHIKNQTISPKIDN